jgi:hypothetical protein
MHPPAAARADPLARRHPHRHRAKLRFLARMSIIMLIGDTSPHCAGNSRQMNWKIDHYQFIELLIALYLPI